MSDDNPLSRPEIDDRIATPFGHVYSDIGKPLHVPSGVAALRLYGRRFSSVH
jgi:hypothetical protein